MSCSSPRFEACPSISNKFCICGEHATKTILTSSDGHQFSKDTGPGRSDLSGDLRGEERAAMSVDAEVLLSPWICLAAVAAPCSFLLRSRSLSFLPSLWRVLLHEFRRRWTRLCHFRSRLEPLQHFLTQGRVKILESSSSVAGILLKNSGELCRASQHTLPSFYHKMFFKSKPCMIKNVKFAKIQMTPVSKFAKIRIRATSLCIILI